MNTYTFPAWCSYGSGDSGESLVEIDLTEEEEALLLKYGTDADTYYNRFCNCSELHNLYIRVYEIAVDQITSEILFYGDFDESEKKPEGWRADDTYPCEVGFPTELEDMIEDEEK